MTRYITVKRRLRPIRFAFLLRPENAADLRRSIEISTCLWGGRFNVIVPALSSTPENWDREHLVEIMTVGATTAGSGPMVLQHAKSLPPEPARVPLPGMIMEGYLSAFEPDYIVEMQKGLAATADLPNDYVLQAEEVIPTVADSASRGIGLKALEVYQHLYEREFRFVSRHPRRVGYATAKESDMSLFVAATFGAFPADEALSDFRRTYVGTLDAEEVSLDLANFLKERFEGPLRVGSSDLSWHSFLTWHGPTLFFMDGCKALDIIDYWNLRALGWNVVPVPRQWAGGLAEPAAQFLRQNVLRDRRGRRAPWPTLLLSRSVRLEDASAFRAEVEKARMAVSSGGALPEQLTLQWWYPRIWDAWGKEADGARRCQVTAEEQAVECTAEEGYVRFDLLTPRFATHSSYGQPSWINVVQFEDYSQSTELALAFPNSMKRLSSIFETIGHDQISASSEGLVVRCESSDWAERWRLPTGTEFFTRWMGDRGLQVSLSDAGRVTLEVIRSLGGLRGLAVVAHPQVLRLLDEMASGKAEDGRSVPHGRWLQVLKQAFRPPKFAEVAAQNRLRSLTHYGVIRLGLRIKCEVCGGWNWYSLDDLAERVRCQRCLREFNFPRADPKQGVWHYRTQGPFSVANYAQGGYTVALALRFLIEGILPAVEATWIPSCEVVDGNGSKSEIDFALFWQRRPVSDGSEPSLLFGECKSRGAFTHDDVQGMKAVRTRFPQSVLVFATLREALSTEEKKLFSDLVNDGRPSGADTVSPAAILLLTGHELMGMRGLPGCWREAGGRFAEFAARWHWSGGLLELCEATQRLHLELEPPVGAGGRA